MNNLTQSQKAYWNSGKPDQNSVNYIQNILGCHRLTAEMLVNRGILSLADIKNFFSANLSNITPPWKIKDIDLACKRIYQAIMRKEKILIFGDYDADGITSAAILHLFLKPYSKNISYFIPDREKDGYGFSKKHVERFKNKGINLIITVDCGSSNHDSILLAKKKGMDTIVTDHHKIDSIPEAFAVLNPHRKDCGSGLTHLAGVGVVFYLLIQLRKTLREANFFKNIPEPNLSKFLDLVAIGTIADMVPLVKENRIFTKSGINLMRKNPRSSLLSMMKLSFIEPGSISSQDIAFQVAPRLNSPGRLENANICVDLLCSNDTGKIKEISSYLNKLNSMRKEKENSIVLEAEAKIEKKGGLDKLLILDSDKWPVGILGTAAAKISKKYNRPCILLTQKNGVLKGSARSIKGFSIFSCLSRFSPLMNSFGGHDQAAGLSIKKENFPGFKDEVKKFSANFISGDMLIQTLEAEGVATFDDFTPAFLKELDDFEPFGNSNPFPLFISKKIIVESHRIIKEIHHSLNLLQPQCTERNRLKAMLFNFKGEIPKHISQALIRPASLNINNNSTDIFIEALED